MKQAFKDNLLSVPEAYPICNTNYVLPFSLISDEGVPLKSYLLRPYARRSVHANEQRVFNYRLSRARRVIENAFGILVSRWQILQRPLALKITSIEKIVQAVTCLHNYEYQRI